MNTATAGRGAAHQPARSRKLVIGIGAPLLLIGAMTLWQRATSMEGYPAVISVAEAAARRDAGAFVLDVRQPEEWAEVRIPGSTLIPLRDLSKRLNEVPREGEIVVVCRSGNRSQAGRDILRRAGFTRATSMAGGLRSWAAARYPTVNGP